MSLRNWIITRSAPGMASRDSFYGQPQPLDRSVLDQCLSCVFRTGGSKPTGRWCIRGYHLLINPDRYQQQGNQYPRYTFDDLLQDIHRRSRTRINRFSTFLLISSLSCNWSSIQMKAITSVLPSLSGRRDL